MTAAGFLVTDTLSTTDHSYDDEEIDPDHDPCTRHVFHYLDKLPTYSQVIPTTACTGAHALYEKVQERYGSPTSSAGLTYVNTRPIKFPGGTTLPARSIGHLLSGDGSDFIVLCWQHTHSGWKVILEVLTDYVNRTHSGTHGVSRDVTFGPRGGSQPISFRLENIGVEIRERDDAIVTNALDLLHSVMRDNAALAEELLDSLEAGDHVVAHTMTEAQPPDLVQLTTMILEGALSRTTGQGKNLPPSELITSAISVLSVLLTLPRYSNRVWLYVRSTSALFGSGRLAGTAAGALSAERITGHYTMTLALLHLVQQLFHEASSSVLVVLPENPRLQQVKEEVLLRATRFVHSEIWVEHLGWKYAQLGDKFEIGRKISSLYADILIHAPYSTSGRPFATLSQAIADLLLYKATTSTINPLVSSITASASILGMLYSWRRYGDARRLIFQLQSHLRLTRVVLNRKQMSTKLCLLEQTLCAQCTTAVNSLDSNRSKVDPVDVLVTYVKGRDVGNIVPLEAINVLYTLCSSLSSSEPSPPTIISHLSDPEETVKSLVRIIQHPYDELSLRNAVWNFISLAVDKEPALASLFVQGQFRFPSHREDRDKSSRPVDNLEKNGSKSRPTSAIDVSRDIVSNWKELWELNPHLLASVLHFLDVVWQHGLEHMATLEVTRQDSDFWDHLASVAAEELGPVPDYKTEANILVDGVRRSHLHEAVSMHAYRTMAKSYALHVLGLDIGIHLQSQGDREPVTKSISFLKIEAQFRSEEQLMDLISEAAPSSYDPQLYDEFVQHTADNFPALDLEELRSQDLSVQREFGDDFIFSTSLLQTRLHIDRVRDTGKAVQAEEVERLLQSINLNLSLAHAQKALAGSWEVLLRQVSPYLRSDDAVRSIVLTIATSVAFDIGSEKRSGDMMATIHGTRLSLLLALLELPLFSTLDKPNEIQSFVELVQNVHRIILNEAQPPAKSFLGSLTVPFHRCLLQIIYFCSRHCRTLAKRPKALNADHRLTIVSMYEAALVLVIDALRLVFDTARSRKDVELDRDMELLVAVFEQCTRPAVNPSSILWLSRCQETDLIRVSLDLFVHTDLVGLSDIPLLLARRKPLYALHILLFHMALTSISSGAERFASSGVLVAYSNNNLSSAISAGMIDVTLPELPGERSPAHRVYCSMLAVVAGVVGSLGRQHHFFDAEASGFVQLYGDQISRALSWTIGDPLTFPLLEEIEQVVNLFYAIAESAPSTGDIKPATEKVLRVFSTHALLLLQQLNYALTHPNHLASMLEPVTAEERALIEKDASQSSLDPWKRPLIARLIHRLFTLSNAIISTLISISRADRVLVGQEDDWPVHEALIVPVRSMFVCGFVCAECLF
jgi:nuclear pore complex protein Nup188